MATLSRAFLLFVWRWAVVTSVGIFNVRDFEMAEGVVLQNYSNVVVYFEVLLIVLRNCFTDCAGTMNPTRMPSRQMPRGILILIVMESKSTILPSP